MEELAKIVACLQWHRDQIVVGLASDSDFMRDLECHGGEEDLVIMEFIHSAISINNLD